MRKTRNFLRSTIAACVLGVSYVPNAIAATWPEKPIRLLVGFAPGGPTDVVARAMGQRLGEALGQPIIIENRAGAAGNIATAALRQAMPDGYTLLYNTSSIIISPHIYNDPGFDPFKDLEPIGLTAATPLVLAVNPKVPANTPAQLMAMLKNNPNHYNYASSGTGAIEHLTAAHLLSMTGVQAVHVPYKGTAPAQVDLIAGVTQFTTTTLNTIIGPARAGTLRPLAVTSKERSAVFPDVPTIAETLIPNFESLAWQGIVAPAGTPSSIVNKVNTAINQVLKLPDIQERLKSSGVISLGGTTAYYRDYIKSEFDRWGEVVKQAGVPKQ